ncbi:MAG: MFS transporter [Mycobacterium sp.]|nr:MFS transporter [Mycobacterium sp.]
MTLDSSVMNVSIATVASDLGTTVTGIQSAITFYTLVMATLMLTGGKIGANIGRLRAFSIGCVIYGIGSLTTALSPNLTVLIIGWSVLEGIGAALIMPAIVALVASNVPPQGRPSAYGLIAAAGAVAVAVGPLIGGAVTTYASWRLVFAGEVVIVVVILILARRMHDVPPTQRPRLDFVGSILSVLGLGMAVYGVLRSGIWGWITPKAGAPDIFGLSPTAWLLVVGLLVVRGLFAWESRLERTGGDPLVRPSLFRHRQLVGGLTMFLFQYLVQAGIFFTIPLFLSVVLELSAVETGVRLVPLSLALLVSALGVPRVWPNASPRRVVQAGLLLLLAATALLIAVIDPPATPSVVTIPLILVGLGIGALASQLGAVTVSSVPDSESATVGGLQNTSLNLGASLGTALVGSMLIATMTTIVLDGIISNPSVPDGVKVQAEVTFGPGVPFVSDTALSESLQAAGVAPATTQALLDLNAAARLQGLRAALFVVVLAAMLALFFTGWIPMRQPGEDGQGDGRAEEDVPDAGADGLIPARPAGSPGPSS